MTKTATAHERPILTVDVALLALIDQRLHVALARARGPVQGPVGLAGRLCARRRRRRYGPDRPPRAARSWASSRPIWSRPAPSPAPRAIRAAGPRRWCGALHAADALQPLADDGRITLHDIEALPALAFDHNRLIALAAQRLRAKSAYTSIVAHLLHDEFTIPQVQAAFEAVTGHRMNAANFRRKILETGALRETRIVPAAYRPAQAYRLAEPLTDFGQNLAR